MITADTEISVYPEWVEYRNDNTFGTQVIRVYLNLYIPRVETWIAYKYHDQLRREPLTLPLDEIVEFCLDACRRTQHNVSWLGTVRQALDPKPSEPFGEQS